MKEKEYSNIYFIGIGGIGVSALARYFKYIGKNVSGYDRTPSPLTGELEAEGIPVHYTPDTSLIPSGVEDTLVVYSSAIHEDMPELAYALSHGYDTVKRAHALGEIAKGQKCLAVSGTHGKTTISTMTAHLLRTGGIDCSAFLGGISRNFHSNFLIGEQKTVVVEADEFDRSFLTLYPHTAVVTAMDPDHLDIYGTPENYREAFRNFVAQCSDTLLIKRGLPLSEKDTPAKILTYSLDDPLSDYHAENIHPDSMGHFHYDLVHPGGVVKGIRVGTLGRVGAENSIAAAALALREGVDEGSLKEGISSFLGAERRMEVHINRPGLTYIDDYAHHPDELRATLSSIRGIFPGRKITAIFQPHLFSRTRDLSEGFADALSLADEVILLDIYPAREEPIPGVTSDIILRGITCPRKTLIHKEQLLSFLGNESEDVLVSFGAGDISSYVEPITSMLEKKYPSA